MEKRGITLQPTHVCDRIFIFLIADLRLLAFIIKLFLHLHHQGIGILITLRAMNVGPCHHGIARPQVAKGETTSYMEGSCE
jgi:hypothetical protein